MDQIPTWHRVYDTTGKSFEFPIDTHPSDLYYNLVTSKRLPYIIRLVYGNIIIVVTYNIMLVELLFRNAKRQGKHKCTAMQVIKIHFFSKYEYCFKNIIKLRKIAINLNIIKHLDAKIDRKKTKVCHPVCT